MTSKQKAQNKIEIIAFIKSKGFTEDRWGNYKKSSPEKTYRFKINPNALRYEAKYSDSWIRICSGYWKDLSIENDKIKGLKY